MAMIKRFVGKLRWWMLVVLVLAGGTWYGVKRHKAKKAAAPTAATIVPVTRGDLDVRFQEIGDIAAKNKADVASKVSGRVIELFVEEGARVSEGQKLAVIQPGRTESERYLPSTLTAPIGGVVMRYVKDDTKVSDGRFVEVGDYVTGIFESQNPTYLLTVADMRKLIVKLKISEMDVLKLEEGMPVTVTVDAVPQTEFPASVSMIAPQAEKDSSGGKVFRVEITFEKLDKRLRTGMTARVDALLKKQASVLKVPVAALFDELGRIFVYKDVPGEKPQQVAVTTGLRTEAEAELLTGLKEGDKVHTEKPTEFTPAPPATGEDARREISASRRKARQVQRSSRMVGR